MNLPGRRNPCSADFQSAASRISDPQGSGGAGGAGRFKTCDTADWKSALPGGELRRGETSSLTRFLRRAGWTVPALLALACGGCGHLFFPPSQPKAQVASLKPAAGEPISLALLEVEAMRFADSYASLNAEAADDFVAKAATPQARIAGVKWKLSQATAAYIDASGPNAVLNALDLVVLATASRMVIESYGREVFGEPTVAVLEVQRRLETNAWDLVDRVLNPDQQKELMDMIQAWRRQNPDQRHVEAIRFRELAVAVGKAQQVETPPPNSVFSLLFLNPLSGLDPTTVAIQETRQLAERAMYYSQRLPTLLDWQVQLLSLQLVNQPETKQILSDTERLTRSTEAFARLADQLPQVVNDQREAAINQILAGLAVERTNLFAGLAAEEAEGPRAFGRDARNPYRGQPDGHLGQHRRAIA